MGDSVATHHLLTHLSHLGLTRFWAVALTTVVSKVGDRGLSLLLAVVHLVNLVLR